LRNNAIELSVQAARAPTDYGLLCLVFVTLGWQQVFASLYALMFAGTALFVLAALPKWYREASRFRKDPA